jgi:regulator of protease activity HflC (stomatin/prohibitin superfamily)
MFKNLTRTVVGLFAVLALSACNLVAVDDGEEAVLVKKPWFIGEGGTVMEAHTGSAWVAWSTEGYRYNLRPKRYTISFNDITSNDNVPMSIEATAVLRIKRGESPVLHNRFGKEWYENNVEHQFAAFVRNVVRQNDHISLVSDEATTLRGQDKIKENLIAYIEGEDMPVIVDSVILGRAVPPKAILEQIAATAAQSERKRTEANRAEAENARAAAETAKAKADNAYMEAMDFSPEQYIAMRQLEIEREKVELVRDKQNVHIIMQSGSGPAPMATFKTN